MKPGEAQSSGGSRRGGSSCTPSHASPHGLASIRGDGLAPWVVPSVLLPTNHRLLDASLDKASPEAEALLARWGRLHAVRSALSLVAFASFLILLARG